MPGSELIRAEDPVTIVIFGASGDLAKRKLIPALYHLAGSRVTCPSATRSSASRARR